MSALVLGTPMSASLKPFVASMLVFSAPFAFGAVGEGYHVREPCHARITGHNHRPGKAGAGGLVHST